MSTCSLVLGSEHLQSRLQSMVSSFYLSCINTNIHLHLPTWKSAHMHTLYLRVFGVPETLIIILVTGLNLSVLILSSCCCNTGISINKKIILSQFICHIFAPVAFWVIGNPLPYSSVSLKCSPWPDALNLTIHSSSSTPSPVYHSSPTSCGFTDGWVSIHVTVVFCAPTCSAKLCRKRLAVKVDLCWFMPGLIKKEKTIYYPSWPKVDCCTGGVIQTVVIAPSMGAYSTLQECELPQSVHFFFISK